MCDAARFRQLLPSRNLVWEAAMRIIKMFALTAALCGSLASVPVSQVVAEAQTPALAVGPQYDTALIQADAARVSTPFLFTG